ncbi:MAG: winged helix-turn-helix domain-containing protein [Promethearchaeota archaeon]
MTEEGATPEYEDIIRYEPESLVFVWDDEANDLLWDLSINPIIRILREKPMTIREIEATYNEIAKDNSSLDTKSETTIYRYVKSFEKAGIVTQAGRRVYKGKTATEILYCRTAKVFLNRNLPLSYWNSKRGKNLFRRIFASLGPIYDGHRPIKKCMQEFIPAFEEAKDDFAREMLDKLDEESLHLITDGDMWEIGEVFAFVRIFGVLLNKPEILDTLRNCFEKTSE